MAGIDTRIVIIGIPEVAHQLGADPEQVIWITQAYVLASTVMLLLIGRLADIFGRTRIFTAGFAIFTIGSALTSFGQNPIQVILFRAVQGVGASFLLTNSLAIVTDATPKNELGLAVGINQISFRAGAIIGLTLSGLILSYFDWRALFYINVPIGIFGTFWSHRKLKEIGELDNNAKIDWVGFVAFFVFILSLLLVFTFTAYGLSQNLDVIYALLGVSLISLVGFLFWQNRIEFPLLDLSIFRIRRFTGGIVALFLNALAWSGVLLLLSLEFQLARRSSPIQAGLEIIPFEIAFLLVGPLSGRLSDKFGHLLFSVSGLIFSGVSLYFFHITPASAPYVNLALIMVAFGIGTGLFLAPVMRTVMGTASPKRRGISSATMLLFFNLGLTLSLNVVLLTMSQTAPYSLISKILTSVDLSGISSSDINIFSLSLRNTYLWLAAINLGALLPLLIGGRQSKKNTSTIPQEDAIL